MPGVDETFPEPLRPDSRIALTADSIHLPPSPSGPVHGAQYVIEVAGPKSVTAVQAHALLGSPWHGALGNPEVWAMAPADEAWRPMATHDGGSYDSVALSWDLIGEKGELSTASAKVLLQSAERFAQSVERRAFPFPAPEEVDRLVKSLLQAQEAFDIGVELFVQGPAAFPERDVWIAAAALGFDLSGDGIFAWKAPGWDGRLLNLAPVEEGRSFSLGGVQRGETYEALSVGFNVPASPDPVAILEKAFEAAERLAASLHANAYDDEGHPLQNRTKEDLRRNLQAGVGAMQGSGLKPGTPICRKLFSTC